MSIQSISDPSKIISKKTFTWKTNDSGELDVFEAAKYFSDLNEISVYNNGSTTMAEKIMIRDDNHQQQQQWRSGGRMSLDMAAIRDTLPSSQHFREKQQQQTMKEKKFFKQPSSPGGKLASFLNSLFNQTSSKKKKSKSKSTSESLSSMRDNDEDNESPGGMMRRKRRSSISHFRVPSINTKDSKSIYSTSSSGFRTPPPYAYTPTKSYKDLDLQVVSLPKVNGNYVKSIDEKSRLSNGKVSEKYKNISSRFPEKSRTSWADQYLTEEKEFKKFNEVIDDDDGADSDSSSDLFELPNFDLDSSSSGLPVYETTNVDSIKRGVPSSSVTRI